MINKHFPTPFDIEQTINFRETSYKTVKKFLQEKGIFCIGNSKSGIAKVAKSILFEHKDYVNMRRYAQGGSSAFCISGFILRGDKIPLTRDIIIQDILAKREQLNSQEADRDREGAPTREVGMPLIGNNDSISLNFSYQRLIPGRVELMERVDTRVQLSIVKMNSSQWEVTCFPDANQDIQTVKKLLFYDVKSGLYTPTQISLENFTQKQRIQFFDDVLDCYRSHKDWSLQQVISLSLKRDNLNDDGFGSNHQSLLGESLDNDLNGEELDGEFTTLSSLEEEEIDESINPESSEELQRTKEALQSISQAVLEGTHLRENKLVKDCEAHGFYFPSMTLRLENRKSAELIEVTIRFKLSPKLFEVVLENIFERNDLGGYSSANCTDSRQKQILKDFWDICHEIWNKINSTIPVERQMALSDILTNEIA